MNEMHDGSDFYVVLVVCLAIHFITALLVTPLFFNTDKDVNVQLSAVRLVGAILTVSILAGCATVAAMFFTPLHMFGVMHVAWLDLVLVMPTTAIVLLIADRLLRSERPLLSIASRWLLIVIAVSAPALWWYASVFELNNLKFERATLERRRDTVSTAPLTIGVLADIQTDAVDKYEYEAIDELMAEQPDIIVVPGDIFQGWPNDYERERENFRTLLSRLDAPGGVYFTPGDTENGYDEAEILRDTGVVMLHDEIGETQVNGRRVVIGGLALNVHSRSAMRVVDALSNMNAADDDLVLLVAHRPDAVMQLSPNSRVDLVIAGHTHGGQVVIPWLGPPLTLSDVPRDIAAGGLHSHDGNHIYVSRGLGHEQGQAPPIRFLCSPEISVITVR